MYKHYFSQLDVLIPSEGCREDCKITLTVKKPNSMPPPPPPCQPYSQECMILECLPCGPDGTGNKVKLKYVKGREKSLCYTDSHFKKFCCTMNSTMVGIVAFLSNDTTAVPLHRRSKIYGVIWL